MQLWTNGKVQIEHCNCTYNDLISCVGGTFFPVIHWCIVWSMQRSQRAVTLNKSTTCKILLKIEDSCILSGNKLVSQFFARGINQPIKCKLLPQFIRLLITVTTLIWLVGICATPRGTPSCIQHVPGQQCTRLLVVHMPTVVFSIIASWSGNVFDVGWFYQHMNCKSYWSSSIWGGN